MACPTMQHGAVACTLAVWGVTKTGSSVSAQLALTQAVSSWGSVPVPSSQRQGLRHWLAALLQSCTSPWLQLHGWWYPSRLQESVEANPRHAYVSTQQARCDHSFELGLTLLMTPRREA